MAKLLVFFALCVLPAIASAIPEPYTVTGKVYCDTCRVGFETSASTYIPGCVVRLVCKKRVDPKQITFTKKATTDSTGKYEMQVAYDAGDDICEVELFKSSDRRCASPNAGRDRARVCLSRNNGMVSNIRYANSLGYFRDVPLARCPKILQQYQDLES